MRAAWLLALLVAVVPPAGGEEKPAEPKSFLLVAKKNLPDPFFSEAVVLVVKGRMPMGVILNKPLDRTLASVFGDNEKLLPYKDPLFFGGPVKRDEVAFLFRAPATPRSLEVLDGIHLSADPELLRELLERDKPLEGLRVYAGHAGWAPGQLEAEIERGGWHVMPAEARHVFHANPRTLWRQLESRASSTQAQRPSEPINALGSYVLPSLTTR